MVSHFRIFENFTLYTDFVDKAVHVTRQVKVYRAPGELSKVYTIRNTKHKSDFTTYIPQALKPYFRDLQGITGHGSLVFANRKKNGAMDIPRKPIMQIIKQTGIEFSSHDSRRTFATIAADQEQAHSTKYRI